MIGKAFLEITADSNDVQISNFGSNSFQITNIGKKNIAQIEIDVTNALYPDSVFDPLGLAGDTTYKVLTIDGDDGTGVVSPGNSSYLGIGGSAGYKGLRLQFDNTVNGGFEFGETIGFSVDMDPNSVAGTEKDPLDGGSNPGWDVGGVSGAELIGSNFTVTFTDGTTAAGQLQGTNSQAGSQALADQSLPDLEVSLTVNGVKEGEIGTYDSDSARVIINGAKGRTARVVLTKGFIQPVSSYASFLENQLDVLAASDFPANNAVEFQTVDILLTGENQDICDRFDLTGVDDYDFAGEERLPIGFVASIIDVDNNDFALGAVTQPIYLQYAETDTVIPVEQPEVESDNNSSSALSEIVVQAEMLDLTGYRIENNPIASAGILSLVGGDSNEVGSASLSFSGESGNYNVILGTYDENDGEATIEVALEGAVIGSVVLDENRGGNAISSDTRVSRTVAENISIAKGDRLTIKGWEDATEHARVDYIKFEPVESPTEADTFQPVQPLKNGINVNFSTAKAQVLSGFIQDIGLAYSATRGYGWVTQASAGGNNPTPLDMQRNPRDRQNLFDDGQGELLSAPVGDSFMHMQYPTNLSNSHTAQLTPGAWEYDLANGRYEVTVGVGDSNYFDSVHTINVEGEALISDFTPIVLAENNFLPEDAQVFGTGSAIIEVDDGRLTVDAIGGENTKISYIAIAPVDI